LKKLTKKEIKAFIRTYLDIMEIVCEEYNVVGEWRGEPDDLEDTWRVQELKPELALINHLFIGVPFNGSLDFIKLGKESKGAVLELIRVDPKLLYSKRYRKKRKK
jgi:hypothetical protein